LPAVAKGTVLGRLQTAPTPEERVKLQNEAMERITDERFGRPVPRFLTELPFGGDDDEISDRIAAAVLVAEDPDRAQDEQGTTGGRELVNQAITIWDLRVMDGDLEGGWGAYLLLDVSVKGSEEHRVVTTGSKQIVTRLARCWTDGQLPVEGSFCEIAGTGKKGNAAMAFVTVAPPF
jgi:hypothetical protein